MKKALFRPAAAGCACLLLFCGCAREASVSAAQTAKSVSAAGQALFERLSQPQAEETVFFSPASIYLCYALLHQGARGDTARALSESLFGFAPDADTQADACAALLGRMEKKQSGLTLHAANSLWVDQGFSIERGFLRAARRLGAQAKTLDFSQGPAPINRWASKQTDGMIEELLPQLDPGQCLVLLSAVGFEAGWETPFDPSGTAPRVFHAPKGDVERPMMSRAGEMDYREDEAVQAVRLPYAGGEASMVLMLPKSADWRPDFSALEDFVLGMEPRPVALTLPVTQIDYDDGGALKSALEAGGLGLLFDSRADLRGIGEGLFVSGTRHRASLRIDEAGTKAAAATSIALAGGAAESVPDYVPMTLDRPFYCAVTGPDGLLLFCGLIADPAPAL